jgi:hypothetical protein
MPRAFEAGSPRLEETWPRRLEEKLSQYCWITNCQGGRAITAVPPILKTAVYYYRPALTLLSVGVVDCAYRALAPGELGFVQKLPGPLSRLIRRIVRSNHYRLTQARKIPYTSMDEFRQTLKEAAQFCAQIETTLVYVPILPPGAHMRETSYDIEANIERYNGIVAEILPPRQIVDLSEIRAEIDRLVLQDGHHLNALGHEKCADRICRSLSQLGFAA